MCSKCVISIALHHKNLRHGCQRHPDSMMAETRFRSVNKPQFAPLIRDRESRRSSSGASHSKAWSPFPWPVSQTSPGIANEPSAATELMITITITPSSLGLFNLPIFRELAQSSDKMFHVSKPGVSSDGNFSSHK